MVVFISYNKGDRGIAREIALYLAAENVGVWFDEWRIAAGDSIPEQINVGLRGCTHYMIIWSARSAVSPWVNRELQSTLATAIQKGFPKVIPVVLDSTPLPSIISDLKYIRYTRGTEADRTNLVSAVTGHAPSQDFIRAVVRKYHEVITDAESGGPLALRACPQCGSTKLKTRSATDYARDEVYYIAHCSECGWSDWTQ